MLENRRILITRPASQAATTVAAVRRLGGVAVVVPLIAVESAISGEALASACAGCDFIAITSANGARAYIAALAHAMVGRGRQPEVWAVGLRTAQALRADGVGSHDLPDSHDAGGLADALISA